MDAPNLIEQHEIENRIYTIRGMQVMLDNHLAELSYVDTKVLNQAVKRNDDRFSEAFRFKLTLNELNNLRNQIGTSSSQYGGRRYLPYVFTEQGVAMLSAVLRSETAVKVSVQIMNAFVEMRKLILGNAALFQRIDNVEHKQLEADNSVKSLMYRGFLGEPEAVARLLRIYVHSMFSETFLDVENVI